MKQVDGSLKYTNNIEDDHALQWNDPPKLLRLEQLRYLFENALKKIIANVFDQYVPARSQIYEVGAGQGYLKDLIPNQYYSEYISSDYNLENLIEGQKRRVLTIERASATSLPLSSNSKDCVVDMDAYDTLTDLQAGINEVYRVLRPRGLYIHFQVNYPNQDLPSHEYPDYIFFPPRRGDSMGNSTMIGIKKQDLSDQLKHIQKKETRKTIKKFMLQPKKALAQTLVRPDLKQYTQVINDALDLFAIDKLAVPSLPDYLKTQLEKSALQSGFAILESDFRSTSVRVSVRKDDIRVGRYNVFSIETGIVRMYNNIDMKPHSHIIEKATILVFVAQKH